MMVNTPGLCFVIVGDGLARYVRPGPDNRPHTIRTLGLAATGPTWQTDEHPSPGSANYDQSAFVHLLVERLNEDFAAELFTDLVLIAPAVLLHQLIAHIEVPRDARLIGNEACDLVSVPDHQLGPRLRSWCPPPGTDDPPDCY